MRSISTSSVYCKSRFVRKIVAEYQIYDPEILKRLAARPVDA